jgi:Putative peptidoglycan binding domain.
VAPAGEERRVPVDQLELRSAWVVWRNVDLLPTDPATGMTPMVIATVGLRLGKLGFLSGPPPATADGRLEQAIRRFQRSAGLDEDGIMGPRTTVALARATAGPFGPTLQPPPATSRPLN